MNWDCEIGRQNISPCLYKPTGEIIECPSDYIGKRLRLTRPDYMVNAGYYKDHNISHYCNEKWGFIGPFLFSITDEMADSNCGHKIGILETVLGE